MARPLKQADPAARERRALRWALVLAVALHVLGWLALRTLLQPPSLLKSMAPTFYTRTLVQQRVAAQPAQVPAMPAADSVPNRPSAGIRIAQQAPEKRASKPRKPARPTAAEEPATPPPEPPASAASAAETQIAAAAAAFSAAADSAVAPLPVASEVASAALAVAADAALVAPAVGGRGAAASAPASAALAAASAPASAAVPAFVKDWPADTQLRYALGGNFRGELHGDARVLWQHEGARYQASVQLDVGLLLSMNLTSQGRITPQGLAPAVYEEQVRQRRRSLRLEDEDIRLNSGERVPRPAGVQDAASQFVELSHQLATGRVRAEPGARIQLWLARPGGVDEWAYDVVGEETLQLPQLGAVRAIHLKPRPLAKAGDAAQPGKGIVAEIWFAPTLQYLPVRILLTQGEGTFVDLLVKTIEQK